MIKLRTFIPEIKILPNQLIKPGQVWEYDNGEDFYEIFIIEVGSSELYYGFGSEPNEEDGDFNKYSESISSFKKNIKSGILKLNQDIKEIKIQPNRKYQVGDRFENSPNLMINGIKVGKGETMIITAIKDGNVYYDTVDGYWANMDSVNFRTIEEFNRIINKGDWVIIPKNIDEIKIVPNINPQNLEQLERFVKKNRNEIIDKTLEYFVEFDEEGYTEIFDEIKNRGKIKIVLNYEGVIIQVQESFLIIFLPNSEGEKDWFHDDGLTKCDINIKGVKLTTGLY